VTYSDVHSCVSILAGICDSLGIRAFCLSVAWSLRCVEGYICTRRRVESQGNKILCLDARWH
jgi:hypothetical protein